MTFQVFQPFRPFRPFTTPVGGVNALAALIKALFGNDEQGGLWLPGPDTCFTDVAGTIPSGEDDIVRRITDLSGNGNHATQASADAAPALKKTAGGLWHLAFDGIDDHLDYPGTNAASNYLFGFAVQHTTRQGNYLFDTETGRLVVTTNEGGKPGFFDGAWKTNGTSIAEDEVLVFDLKAGTGTAFIRRDGESLGAGLTYAARAVGGARKFFIRFATPFGTSALEGRSYGWAMTTKTATADDVAKLEALLAARSGVTLP